MSFPLLLALKYLKPKRSVASVITFVSILGVMLGVAVVIIVLRSGQTVYIEEGAWVYGSISADGADGIAILGEGVLSGEKAHRDTDRREKPENTAWSGYAGRILVDLVRCRNLRIGRVSLYDGM